MLRQFALKVAALLLVLHWTAPNLVPFQPFAQPGDSTPTYSRAEVGIHHGTLPRALARIQTLEAGATKAQRDELPPTGKLAALASAGCAVCFGLFAAEPITRPAPRVAITAHTFQARGPPVL